MIICLFLRLDLSFHIYKLFLGLFLLRIFNFNICFYLYLRFQKKKYDYGYVWQFD